MLAAPNLQAAAGRCTLVLCSRAVESYGHGDVGCSLPGPGTTSYAFFRRRWRGWLSSAVAVFVNPTLRLSVQEV